MNLSIINAVKTPAVVLDVKALKRNLDLLAEIKKASGCQVIFATKSFSTFAAFPIMRDYFEGTTASGLYEAKLGAEEFGKEVHVYSPAYTDEEIEELAKFAGHVYFNSLSQYERFSPKLRGKGIKFGLRINPEFSQVGTAIYNPCAPCSRFGVLKQDLPEKLPEDIAVLHFHALCQNTAEESAAFINHVKETFKPWLKQVKYVNLGGGHYYSFPNYNTQALVDALKDIQSELGIQAVIEPGGAVVFDTGVLVASVLDIVKNEKNIAILDTSATCHMPDVIEMPYRPDVIGDGDFANKYLLGGKTCLTGDVIGEYAFKEPLKIGDKVVFTDMIQYSTVKTTTFNGMPLPSLLILDENDKLQLIKEFGYQDFKMRLS